ncbi:membrane protein US30 [Cercopithecine betaherpesvirus 5]|uniref:Membrane protein US30 n=1 Tax=Simian cytomegalovirus (strain Colburn) TaxID=50292 RepID=G8XTN8_SCMVC|nr:membrane protein US30 [Cercopithecine betaherpesvirus 5]AEV80530.1 membrane protein US30 [Cercopithecine betaherpesvirus 5]
MRLAVMIAIAIATVVNSCQIEPGEDVVVEQECRQRNTLLVATGRLTPHSHRPHVLEFTFKTKDRFGYGQRIQLHISGLPLNNQTIVDQPVTWRLFSRYTDVEGGVSRRAKLRLISEQNVPVRHCEIIVGRDGEIEEPRSWDALDVVGRCLWWCAALFLMIDLALNAFRWLGRASASRSPALLRAEMLHNNREMFWKRRRPRHGGVSETPSEVPPRYTSNAPWSVPTTPAAASAASKPSITSDSESPTPPNYSAVFPPFPE